MSDDLIRRADRLKDYRDPLMAKVVQSDTVTLAVSGYYSIPPIWITNLCEEVKSSNIKPDSAIDRQVLDLSCGLKILLTGDGEVLMDFFDFPAAAPIYYPGYSKAPDDANIDPKSRLSITALPKDLNIEEVLARRVAILNVFQFLLFSVSFESENYLSFPQYLNQDDVSEAINLESDSMFPWAFRWRYHAQKAYRDSVLSKNESVNRRIATLSEVRRASHELDVLLRGGQLNNIVLVDEVFYSVNSLFNGRKGAAIIGFWTIIEQMLDKIWTERIVRNSSGRRREKLKSINFTSSIRVETLFIAGHIERDLYESIEIARKGRNDWAHKMRIPTIQEIDAGKEAVCRLIETVSTVCLTFGTMQSIGGSQINIWLDHRMEQRYRSKKS